MLTIAWDIDDVLNELMLTWFTQVWKAEHPDSRLGYSDISQNPPDRVLGISRADYLNSLDRFRASEGARNMPPNRPVLEWLNSFGESYRHIALTARPLESTPHAAEWLFRHFGMYIRTFAVVPSRYADGVPPYDRDKPEYLSWLGKADILVDDSEENIRGAERLGLRGVLYPQPWNRASENADAVLLSITKRVREVR
jgi:hypothetical protein